MPGKRYQVVQRCSELLKLSTVPHPDKLRLEFQLSQIKRLLLKDQSAMSCQHKRCSQGAFDNLEALIREATEANFSEPALERVFHELEEILEVMWALDKAYASYSGLNF